MNAPRISKMTGMLMIGTAVFVDLVQVLLTFVLLVGSFAASLVSVCAGFLFGIWFFHQGVNLFSTGKALGTLGALVGELTPFINDFPWLTLRVTLAVLHEWSAGGAL